MDCHFDRKQPESHVFQIIMSTRLSDSIDISQIAQLPTCNSSSLLKINEISLTFDIQPNFTSNGPVGIVEMALKIYKTKSSTLVNYFVSVQGSHAANTAAWKRQVALTY